MIVAEFTYQAPQLNRVYDTVTGADLLITNDVQRMAMQAANGEVCGITTGYRYVNVKYEIKEVLK